MPPKRYLTLVQFAAERVFRVSKPLGVIELTARVEKMAMIIIIVAMEAELGPRARPLQILQQQVQKLL